MGVVTTSLVVDFSPKDGGGVLKAEIDNRENGYNNGETSFVAGDSPVFLVYKTSNVRLINGTPKSSLGYIHSISSNVSIEVEEYLTFANERTATPTYPIYGNFYKEWFGGSGSVSYTENSVNVSNKTIGVLRVSYTTKAIAYQLSGVPTQVNGRTSFPVVIFIAGEYADGS